MKGWNWEATLSFGRAIKMLLVLDRLSVASQFPGTLGVPFGKVEDP